MGGNPEGYRVKGRLQVLQRKPEGYRVRGRLQALQEEVLNETQHGAKSSALHLGPDSVWSLSMCSACGGPAGVSCPLTWGPVTLNVP